VRTRGRRNGVALDKLRTQYLFLPSLLGVFAALREILLLRPLAWDYRLRTAARWCAARILSRKVTGEITSTASPKDQIHRSTSLFTLFASTAEESNKSHTKKVGRFVSHRRVGRSASHAATNTNSTERHNYFLPLRSLWPSVQNYLFSPLSPVKPQFNSSRPRALAADWIQSTNATTTNQFQIDDAS
jgi:hypothetical protein